MKFFSSFVLLALSVVVGVANADYQNQQFDFSGYRLVRLFPDQSHHADLIQEWDQDEAHFDVWNAKTDAVDVLISPQTFPQFQSKFNSHAIKFSITNNNVQNLVDEQKRSMENGNNKRDLDGEKSIVGKFARLSEIYSFLEQMVIENPEIASTKIIGQTHEQRDLKLIILKTPTSQRKVMIDCGIHAREWISPSTCVYMINQIIVNYNKGIPEAVALLNHYEFHVLPVLNPDGYEYSHTDYRMWRKNRRTVRQGSSCVGVDLNRNSGYQWMTGGSSSNPCSDTYAGPSADSELEIQHLQRHINLYKGDWATYLTLHSYGQWWFTTWGYTRQRPSNYPELLDKARIATEAIEAYHNTKWVYGQSSTILYVASGGSEDWAAGNASIKYAYCLELRPGKRGPDSQYGFLIPESRALLAGSETYRGIGVFLGSIIGE